MGVCYTFLMTILDQTGIPDTLPYCPIKTIMWEELTPLLPEPVPEERPEPRVWQYRVCLSLFLHGDVTDG